MKRKDILVSVVKSLVLQYLILSLFDLYRQGRIEGEWGGLIGVIPTSEQIIFFKWNILHTPLFFTLSAEKFPQVASIIFPHFSLSQVRVTLTFFAFIPPLYALLLDVGPDYGGVGGPAGHGRKVPLLRRGPGNQP